MSIRKNFFDEIYERLRTQLPPHLSYHNSHHTHYVVEKTLFLAEQEQVSLYDRDLLVVAALYHDIGYFMGREEHESSSCKFVRRELPFKGYTELELQHICGMIMATRVPQDPQNLSEKIIADADLFYLGTEEYSNYSKKLYQEILFYEPGLDEHSWLELQYKFLSSHSYHTNFGKTILEPVKQLNMAELRVMG